MENKTQIHKATGKKLGIAPNKEGFYFVDKERNLNILTHEQIIAEVELNLKTIHHQKANDLVNERSKLLEANRELYEALEGLFSVTENFADGISGFTCWETNEAEFKIAQTALNNHKNIQ